MVLVKGILTEHVLDHGCEPSEGLTLSKKIMDQRRGSNWMLNTGIRL
ncbi:hypothetical protein EV13_2671 [Prochlorococcus sp. MIT 0702]|nr:hypothetical protein EV12_2618 [Prochlorococcus sp. MIT 0701]KGG25897.1 hypothetical protein EV13_2671 [Prochlorococcus sp. MIT 0702]KGG30929.1 hypothetical protein EV14_2868 [Prochlorococcus sp. MIT 0703]